MSGALCFEGNIDFYGKSGFGQAGECGIRYHGLPEGEDASFFLCKELIPGYLDGITGEYATPEGYLVDEQEAEEFDMQFPYKEKRKCRDRFFKIGYNIAKEIKHNKNIFHLPRQGFEYSYKW